MALVFQANTTPREEAMMVSLQHTRIAQWTVMCPGRTLALADDAWLPRPVRVHHPLGGTAERGARRRVVRQGHHVHGLAAELGVRAVHGPDAGDRQLVGVGLRAGREMVEVDLVAPIGDLLGMRAQVVHVLLRHEIRPATIVNG